MVGQYCRSGMLTDLIKTVLLINSTAQIAFSRRDRGFFAMNNEKSKNFTRKVRVAMQPGRYCDVISGDLMGLYLILLLFLNINHAHAIDGACTGKQITVDMSGTAEINIAFDDDEPIVAIHAESRVA